MSEHSEPYPRWLQIAAAALNCGEWQVKYGLVVFLAHTAELIRQANKVEPPHVSGAQLQSSQVICLAITTYRTMNQLTVPQLRGTDQDKSVFDNWLVKTMTVLTEEL